MTTLTAPTKRIAYNRTSRDYDAFVTVDETEEYIGSRPTQHDASLLASDYIIQFYNDSHTPEAAAQLIHQELAEEGRHEQLAQDMGAEWATELDGGDVEAVELVDPTSLTTALFIDGEDDTRTHASIADRDEYLRCNKRARIVEQPAPLSLCGTPIWPTPAELIDPACADPPNPDEPTPENIGDEPPIGWGETARIAGFMTGECPDCGTIQRLTFDGVSWVCDDTQACQARQSNSEPATTIKTILCAPNGTGFYISASRWNDAPTAFRSRDTMPGLNDWRFIGAPGWYVTDENKAIYEELDRRVGLTGWHDGEFCECEIVINPGACANCAGLHHIQHCPQIGALLMGRGYHCPSCDDPKVVPGLCAACIETHEVLVNDLVLMVA